MSQRRLSRRARRIVEAMRRLFDAATADDARYAAEVADLQAFDRKRSCGLEALFTESEPAPSGCPIHDCASCQPSPCAVPGPRQRATARVSYWLRTECPEAFNEVNWGKLDRLSEKLLALAERGEIAARWESEVKP